MIELANCPFCDSSKLTGPVLNEYIGDAWHPHCWIECNECPAFMEVHTDSFDVAIAAWNRRTPSAQPAIDAEARNDEREGIACFLEATGNHELAAQIFAGMTRQINDNRRNTAIDAAIHRARTAAKQDGEG